ncbi:MAG: OmpH family outer membrane protein [Chitinophagaceae bacterium]
MKKFLLSVSFLGMLVIGLSAQAQTPMKIAVFDIDIMVQAMPGYRAVDSLVQLYERDSLAEEYAVYQSEYKRLDSTYKADSAANKSKAVLDYTKNQLQQMSMNLVYWQQIAQNKSDNKRGVLSQSMYEQVVNAYKTVLAKKKYTLILKPQTFEAGFPIDNLFISVAKELKLTELPQQLLVLGDDPDAAAVKPPVTPPKK